ncbi:MAG: SCO family protein [Paracoccaceae bacterium]
MPTTRTYAAAAAGGVALIAGGALLATTLLAPTDAFAQCRQDGVAGAAGDIGGPFELVSGTGETVTDADVITEPSIVYFGYTFCPDVCPMDMARNAIATDILEERGIEATPVFITIDPARDDAEVVARFADNFHDRAIGLTGSEAQVAAVSRAYRTYRNAQPDDGSGFYLVDHSTFSYLTLPEHGTVAFFRRDAEAEEVADAVQCFAQAA